MSAAEPQAGAETRKELARFIIEQVRSGALDKERAAGFLRELTSSSDSNAGDIAIIGMAGRFPHADSIDAFWSNLLAGRNCIRTFPAGRRAHLAALDNYETELFAGGFLESVDAFDNEYFQIPPRVARHMDPYQRLMLETLVEAIENAGYHRGALYGKPVGVFVGNDHTHRLFNSYVAFIDEVDFHSVTGSWTGVLASRISYLFNFKGPAVVLDTACSSGLAALDNAIKALRDGDCESALVSAANLFFAPGKGLVGEIENDTFEVRAFDSKARGTAWGEGVAAIMVKPLAHALRDGDPIHAVIRGVALNNDGASNGLTAPNAKAQQEVILKAWERARISADAISYIETHGTGTQLGDPIEIKGLISAFEHHNARRQFCAIGSVKTNIGHTVGVAGLASLLKVVLSLEHERIPASINFAEPNRYIDFCNSPVYVNDRVLPWPRGEQPRVAGVSSFSLSGTNCHLVVQEAPALAQPVAARLRLIPVSARSRQLFVETVQRMIAWLAQPTADIGSIALTAGVGREHHVFRGAVLADSPAALREQLQRLLGLIEAGVDEYAAEGVFCRLTVAPAEVEAADRQRRDAALLRAREAGGVVAHTALTELAALYVNGLPINWAELYRDEGLRRTSLPAQPFERRHFWDKAARMEAVAAGASRQPVTGDATDATPSRETLLNIVVQAPSRVSDIEHIADPADPLGYQVVATIWCEVLGYEQIALADNFHTLGGDSISAMKTVHLLNAIFGLRVELAELLAADSFAAFVELLLEQHALAAATRGEAAAHASDDNMIIPLPPAPSYPLSRAQRRMFLLSRISEGSSAYNVSAVVHLEQPPTVQTEAIIRQVIARHEILRTSFHDIDGEYRQIVHASVPFAIEQMTLPSANDDAAELLVVQEAVARFVQPFDLGHPPLLRVAVMRAQSGNSYLALDMHHIVTDGSSMGVLVSEFARLAAGERLPALPFQYKDFAAWQSLQFDSPAFAAHAAFWRDRFSDELPVLALSTDFPRPAFQDYLGAKAHFHIPVALAVQLQALARAQGCTLYVLLLAAFKTLLYKLGGGRDIVVGSPVAGRGQLVLQGMIGMFVNTLALRDRIAPDDSFAGFLKQARSNTLAALQHQDYPYEELVEALQLPRNGGRNPLFDVCFSLQNEDIGVSDAGVQLVPMAGGTSKFDMTVMMRDTGDGFAIDWEYATALFRPATIARYGEYFERLLACIVAQPEQPLRELSLLGEAERTLLCDTRNATGTAYGGEQGIAALFTAQVDARPDAIAVQMGEQTLSYAELECEANQLAHCLIAHGVVHGDTVALYYDRSIGMVVAILAVLKAGAAYVPLDIDNPPDRLAGIIEDTRPRLLLVGGDTQLPQDWGAPVLHASALDLSGYPASRPVIVASGDDLAYIMFTSGSTGRPKGTLIRQKSVIRVVCATNYLQLGPDDCCLLISNYSFDGSIPDIFGALLNGGCVVVIRRQEVLDPDLLAQIIVAQRVTSFFITTALFNALVDLHPECLADLRYVMFGGEAASLRHAQCALAAMPSGRLVHVYGPTETTVFATACNIEHIDAAIGTLPIGRPIANTSVYVMDEDGQIVPPGVAGELFIGGDGVALGYLNRPDLTAECFVANPFVPGEYLYRTGDLVKWLDEGVLVFLGRLDHQVKIRGFRIELGEVEAAIGRHPDIKACLVTADPDAAGQRLLCAYVVADQSVASSLRSFLGALLPDYMVPGAIVCLDAFPLNASGKVDRRALPPPQSKQACDGETLAARDPREAALVAVWQAVIGIAQVGIHDNFFAIGGDSIKAIQIVARLREKGFHAQVPLLFQFQSIAELAPQLESVSPGAEQVAPVAELPACSIDQHERDNILVDLEIV